MRIIAAFLLASTLGQAQTLTPQGVAEIDALFQSAVDQGTVPGVVAMVAGKDRIIYESAFGLRDVANRKPMRTDSIFRIASMTKPLTSAAVMLLVERKKLRLDDPVSEYLPEFRGREVIASFNAADASYTTRKAAGEVLIRHLLSNTSGMAYSLWNGTMSALQEKTRKTTEELPLLYDPGTAWIYSPSTRVLGRVIEKVSGVPLDRFLEDGLIAPLGMSDTFYVVPAEKVDRVVTVHKRIDGKLTETPNPTTIRAAARGDGGLSSTAADYIRFLQLFLNDGASRQRTTILAKDSIRLMTENQIGDLVVDTQPAVFPASARSFPLAPAAGRDKFGFGFEITVSSTENADLRSPGSYGWAGYYNTHFWVDPKRQIAAVLLIQVLPFYDPAVIELYKSFEESIGRNLR